MFVETNGFKIGMSAINLSIFFLVKSLTNGLLIILGILVSINDKLGRWSEISEIKFPAVTYVWINFLNTFSIIWSIKVAVLSQNLVGRLMHGIKLEFKNIST